MSEKIPVTILGATGLVGQYFVSLLADHPWFRVEALCASPHSVGRLYGDLVTWQPTRPLPEGYAKRVVRSCSPEGSPSRVIFSALDSSVAGEIESAWAEKGCFVFSNAVNHRYDPAVPIFIPEVNPDHLGVISQQRGRGWIVTNPNCCVMGLALALKPLDDAFGLTSLHVTTLQAVSGAGYPGVPALAILDNVIPYIIGEEEKIAREVPKILGRFTGNGILPAPVVVSAHCHRVPVTHGHTIALSFSLEKKATKEEIIEIWREFPGVSLPSAPERPLIYLSEPSGPEPRRHREEGGGMAVTIGRLRTCSLFDWKCNLLTHNAIRGGAGGTILMAEWMMKAGHLSPNSTGWAATPLSSTVQESPQQV